MGSGLGILCDPSALCGAAFQEGKHNRKDCLTCDPFLSLQSVTFPVVSGNRHICSLGVVSCRRMQHSGNSPQFSG